MIVKHHDLIIGRKANVAFDARAQIERSTESCKAIFGNAGAVEPAMCEPHWPWIKQVRL